MDFLLNDLSVEGQFTGIYDFEQAISQVIEIRELTRRFGRELFCHRNLLQAQVTSTMTMHEVVQRLGMNKRRSIMPWLTRHGPFWDDNRHHGSNEYLECNNDIVTDTAIGEAAFCCLNRIDRGLVSFAPSNWEFSPIIVSLIIAEQNRKSIDVQNFWTPSNLTQFLENQPPAVKNWKHLETFSRACYPEIIFSDSAFTFLEGHPFSRSASQRLVVIFKILNHLKQCFDENGQRTAEGHEIYQKFFTGRGGGGGRGSLFSDSSDQEKHEFENDLTFKHPENPDSTLFCPWHGKVQTSQLRVHFSWPIRANEPLYIVYVGPKITMR